MAKDSNVMYVLYTVYLKTFDTNGNRYIIYDCTLISSNIKEIRRCLPFSLGTTERIVTVERDVERVLTTHGMLMGFGMINCRINGRVEN